MRQRDGSFVFIPCTLVKHRGGSLQDPALHRSLCQLAEQTNRSSSSLRRVPGQIGSQSCYAIHGALCTRHVLCHRCLSGQLETSCFQPVSAADFSRSLVAARLEAGSLLQIKILRLFLGFLALKISLKLCSSKSAKRVTTTVSEDSTSSSQPSLGKTAPATAGRVTGRDSPTLSQETNWRATAQDVPSVACAKDGKNTRPSRRSH